MKNFSKALDNIKKKAEWNIIDKRLISIINEFSGGQALICNQDIQGGNN